MVMRSFSGNIHEKILEQRIIRRSINVNTTDVVLNNVYGAYYTSRADIIIPNPL